MFLMLKLSDAHSKGGNKDIESGNLFIRIALAKKLPNVVLSSD